MTAGPAAVLDSALEPPGLLLLLALVLAVAGRELRLMRLRDSLNRALHELRRPLQVLALDSPGMSVRQAIRAVGRLDHALNGSPAPHAVTEELGCRMMVDACVRRWSSRAHLAGADIQLGWIGPEVLIQGDGPALAAAFENLILNAIEHGGPEIRVEAASLGRWVRVVITDSGRASRPSGREGSPAEMIARQRSESHGHGLEIVRQTIVQHGGKLEVDLSETGSTVAVALPCVRSRQAGGAVRVNW